MHTETGSSYNFKILQFVKVKLSVKNRLFVSLLCVLYVRCLERPSSKWPVLCRTGCWTLLTHSLTHLVSLSL